MEKIAFLGLGLMGSRMSRRLSDAGFALTLWNRTPLPPHALAPGCRVAASAAEATALADLVFCCLADSAAVEAVVFGESGVASAAHHGQLLVDFSSISPKATRQMAERLAAGSGMRWVDAPVSGGTQGAQDGTLVIMAGGAEEDIARLGAPAAVLAQRLTHMGPVGAGQVTKLCNQLIVASNALLIAEAVALAQHGGVDATRLAPALQGGFADSLPLQILAPRMAEQRFEPVQWKVATLLKDLDNALALAADCAALLPLATQARELLARHSAAGFAAADLSTLIQAARSATC